jgi:RNA polymerase sigma-70 factor (ECF subfamily)
MTRNLSEIAGGGENPADWGGEIPFFDQGFDQVEGELLMEIIFQDESESSRTICFMYHADGMTLKEIGEALGLSISGVRKRLEAFKARARLKLGRSI